MVLVEASLRLKEEHADAAKRVDQFIKEGDAVLNFAAGVTEGDDSSARRGRSGSNGVDGGGGGGATSDVSGGSNSDGHTSDAHGGSSSSSGRRHGCGSTSSTGGRRRKKHTGYVQEEDSDSDDGERHARIMRSRGPVTLTETFALPLLRSYVTAFKSSSDSHRGATNVGSGLAGAREMASRRSKGWKGKGKQPASRSGKSSGGNEEEEEEEDRAAVSDDQLLDVFRYWAKKREAYGGPMLRCFHPFIMKLWRRMEDPVREVSYSLILQRWSRYDPVRRCGTIMPHVSLTKRAWVTSCRFFVCCVLSCACVYACRASMQHTRWCSHCMHTLEKSHACIASCWCA